MNVHPRSKKEDGNRSIALGSTHNEDQKYWLQSTEEYNDVVGDRPKVSLSMASARKSFWENSVSADKLNSKIVSGKLPANCGFMKQKGPTLKSELH